MSAESIIVHGGSDYKPYIYTVEGTPTGLYVDLVQAVLDQIEEYDSSIKIEPWNRILKGVETGDVFAFFPPYYRPYARPYVVPYSRPLYSETIILLCRNEITESRDFLYWPESAYGLTIGLNVGNEAGGEAYNQAVNKGKIKQIRNKTPRVSLRMLMEGRLDCFIDNRMIIADAMRVEDSLVGLHAITSEAMMIRQEKVYLGFSRHNNPSHKQDFVKKFNEALKEIRENGEYDAIVHRYESEY